METQPQLRQLRNNTTMLFNNQNQPVESVETSVMDSPVTEEENPFIEAKNTPIIEVVNSENKPKHFIEANTKEVSLYHLKNDCIIPVFSKDNEITISHSRFIEALWECTQKLFKNEQIKEPEIRVSHIIKGRTPEAIYKPVKELTDADKTIYYERMAFCMEIPTITEIVGGNTLSLTVGGVRAYNQENLYSKKGIEKFKIFIGFKNMVCCNLCVSTDGLCDEVRVTNVNELMTKTIELFVSYNAKNHLNQMRKLQNYNLTESQFAQLIGKVRLYQYLPAKEKKLLPEFEFTDTHVNLIARNFYRDENFSYSPAKKNINMWQVFNLFTEANKCSYIDTFLITLMIIIKHSNIFITIFISWIVYNTTVSMSAAIIYIILLHNSKN